MIALVLGEDRLSTKKRREDIIRSMKELPEKIKVILENDKLYYEMADTLLNKSDSLLLLGRGYQFATCLEGALVDFNFSPILSLYFFNL